MKIDMHTHTIASGHAYSTIREMAKAAAEKGLEILGITEHAPGIPGTCNPFYFNNIRVIPREMYGVQLMIGAEINILDYDGTLSLDENLIDKVDLRIAGIHKLCYTPGSVKENTQATIAAIQHPKIDIISHPADGVAPLDYEEVVPAAKEFHTLLELNNNSLNPAYLRDNPQQRNIDLLNACKKYQVPILVSSDAHVDTDVSRHEYTLPIITATNFPEELIINNYPEKFRAFIQYNRQHESIKQ